MKCRYCNQFVVEENNEYVCKECELTFKSEELVFTRKDLVNVIEPIIDPLWFNYTTTSDMLKMTTIELINCLGLTRRLKRELEEKRRRNKGNDKIDRDNLKQAKLTQLKLENILIEKAGYYPERISQEVVTGKINQTIQRQERYLEKFSLKTKN